MDSDAIPEVDSTCSALASRGDEIGDEIGDDFPRR
jgi:hypothetical protein